MNRLQILRNLRSPLMFFFVALITGTVWLARPIPRSAGYLLPPLPAVQPPPRLNLVQKPEPLGKPDLKVLRAELDSAQTEFIQRKNSLQASEADVQTIQAQINRLQEELEEMKKRQAGPDLQPNDQMANIRGLEAEIDTRRNEANGLQKEVQQAKYAAPTSNTPSPHIVRAVEPVNKLPVLVELFEDHITPVTKEYFHFPTLSFKSVFVVHRSRLGDTIAEAGQPGSKFLKFLKKLHPKEEYVSCLLNSDSFEAFYAARELAKQNGVEIGWDPADTRDGAIKIAGVELGSESNKNKIQVPDVVH